MGYNCKYTGGNNYCPELKKLLYKDLLIPVCPEELGGLSTPRLPARFDHADGRAVLEGRAKINDESGRDVTENFLTGAFKALRIAKKNGVYLAVLKERSPSCGSSQVYIAARGERPVQGTGVTAALLQQSGIKVCSDEQL